MFEVTASSNQKRWENVFWISKHRTRFRENSFLSNEPNGEEEYWCSWSIIPVEKKGKQATTTQQGTQEMSWTAKQILNKQLTA